MRVGLVGVGRIGVAHAEVVRDHPLVHQLVVGDLDEIRAKEVAAALGVETAPIDALVADVEALMVTAGTDAHPELILRGVQAGVPVFCEKPVADTIEGSRHVLAAVSEAGASVQIGFQRRFDAGYTAARTALRTGELGELRRIHVVTADQNPPPAAFVARSGGIFRDCHVHDFDIIRWVTGREIVEVFATGANRGAAYFGDAGDVDEASAVLTLDDGTLVTVQGSRYNGGGHDVRMELAGTDGTLAVGLDDHSALRSAEPGVSFPDGSPHPDFWHRFLPAYRAEVQAFIDFAAGHRTNPCSVAEAVEAFYVAEAATRSAAERRPVTLEEVRGT